MKQDERHHTSDDFFVGIDLATRQHQVVVLDAQGCRLTSFKVPHSRQGLHELVERCTSPRVHRGRGEVHFAFEATGHVWEAVGAFFEQHALRYHVVNPLATFRVREARQMGRDKRDLTDAEQIAQLLRTGVVTQCQLLPANYMQLRRAWGEYHRLRRERARLKTRRWCADAGRPPRFKPSSPSPTDAVRDGSAKLGHPVQNVTREHGLTPWPR